MEPGHAVFESTQLNKFLKDCAIVLLPFSIILFYTYYSPDFYGHVAYILSFLFGVGFENPGSLLMYLKLAITVCILAYLKYKTENDIEREKTGKEYPIKHFNVLCLGIAAGAFFLFFEKDVSDAGNYFKLVSNILIIFGLALIIGCGLILRKNWRKSFVKYENKTAEEEIKKFKPRNVFIPFLIFVGMDILFLYFDEGGGGAPFPFYIRFVFYLGMFGSVHLLFLMFYTYHIFFNYQKTKLKRLIYYALNISLIILLSIADDILSTASSI